MLPLLFRSAASRSLARYNDLWHLPALPLSLDNLAVARSGLHLSRTPGSRIAEGRAGVVVLEPKESVELDVQPAHGGGLGLDFCVEAIAKLQDSTDGIAACETGRMVAMAKRRSRRIA